MSSSWITPQHSKTQVDRAGLELVRVSGGQPFLDAISILFLWRAAHAFPLNTFQTGLRRKARAVDPNSLVAQRLKRLESIVGKLRRFPTMKLSQVQDIAGCRAVVADVSRLKELRISYASGKMRHRLVREDDYFARPRDSGYRGVHLIYRYESDRTADYNGLSIEVQLRTKMQHWWATAVEVVGTFQHQSLKSSIGDVRWLRFFQLMSAYIALRESAPLPPNVPTSMPELLGEIAALQSELQVLNRLESFSTSLNELNEPRRNAKYFLLELNPKAGRLVVHSFRRAELDVASQLYSELEKHVDLDVVLVSVDSMEALRRAYPNYFSDTVSFSMLVRAALLAE